jgi:hypothetical protein
MCHANALLIAENAELWRRIDLPDTIAPRPAERQRDETRLRSAAPLRGKKPKTDCDIGLFASSDLFISQRGTD